MPRRLKNRDGSWSKKKENSQKHKKPKNYNPNKNGIYQLMGAWVPDAQKISLLHPPSIFKTPPKGTLTPKETHFITPMGSTLPLSVHIQCDDGDFKIFLSSEAMSYQRVQFPKKPTSWLKDSPVPIAEFTGIEDYPISRTSILKASKDTQENKKVGKDPRGINQNKLMRISATKALIESGFDVPPKSAHWTHLLPWALVGKQSQKVRNLGIATSQANARMELVNRALESFLREHPEQTLYLSAIPQWVEGYESIRLLETVTYVIKDGIGNQCQKSATITFDMLALQSVCNSEIDPTAEFLKEKFAEIFQVNEVTPTRKDKGKEKESEKKEEQENDEVIKGEPIVRQFKRIRRSAPGNIFETPLKDISNGATQSRPAEKVRKTLFD